MNYKDHKDARPGQESKRGPLSLDDGQLTTALMEFYKLYSLYSYTVLLILKLKQNSGITLRFSFNFTHVPFCIKW